MKEEERPKCIFSFPTNVHPPYFFSFFSLSLFFVGTGIVSAPTPKKLLQMAGIEDCYTSCTGQTATMGNFGWSCVCGERDKGVGGEERQRLR